MPIYEYRCSSCGHQQEFLQKVSDAPLTVCPQCGKPTFSKMVTAAGFQLKGSGWYATDFKNSGKPASKPAEAKAGKAEAKPAGESKPDTPPKPTASSGKAD
ncbi:MAG TPA: zinc ribbon domain-containing protein [Usitatibacter sp.]|nr:zinc ribbon domain-containing protein [Usitatibacter sp.]